MSSPSAGSGCGSCSLATIPSPLMSTAMKPVSRLLRPPILPRCIAAWSWRATPCWPWRATFPRARWSRNCGASSRGCRPGRCGRRRTFSPGPLGPAISSKRNRASRPSFCRPFPAPVCLRPTTMSAKSPTSCSAECPPGCSSGCGRSRGLPILCGPRAWSDCAPPCSTSWPARVRRMPTRC